MAYYKALKPDTEAVNVQLRKELTVIMQKYYQLEKKAYCDHDWKMTTVESYDGHRSDYEDKWHCTKCNYGTDL